MPYLHAMASNRTENWRSEKVRSSGLSAEEFLEATLPFDVWVDWFGNQDDGFAREYASQWERPAARQERGSWGVTESKLLRELAPAAHERFVERQATELQKLRTLLNGIEGLDLLSLMVFVHHFEQWGSYFEPFFDPYALCVEIVAGLVAADTRPPNKSQSPHSDSQGFGMSSMLVLRQAREVRNVAIAVNTIDVFLTAKDEVSAMENFIRNMLLNRRIARRGEAYRSHALALAEELASDYENSLLNRVGHTVADVIAVSDAIQSYWKSEVSQSIDRASELVQKSLADTPTVSAVIRQMAILTAFKYFVVHKISPTIGELRSRMSADSAERLIAVVKSLGIIAGSVEQPFESVLSDPPTRTKPFLLFPADSSSNGEPVLDDFARILLVNPIALVSDLPQTVDALIGGSFSQNWPNSRARAVDNKAIELISRLLPGCRSFSGVDIDPDGTGANRFEVDGVILFDDAVIFVEGKGAPLKLPSRRGDVARYRGDLKKLIGHGAHQLRRDEDLLKSPKITLLNSKGAPIEVIDTSRIHRSYQVLPCFDDYAGIGTQIEILRKWDIVEEESSPWIVSVPDLNVVTDALRGPAELFAYMTWRTKWLEDPRILKLDEIELLSQFQYAVDIEAKIGQSPEGTLAMFSNKQPDFDRYYAGLDDTGPKYPIPRRKTPPRVRRFVDEMERRRPAGWIGATTAVLCAPGTVPAAIDASERQFAQLAREKRVHVASMSDMRLVVCGDTTPWSDVVQECALEPSTYPTWLLRADIRRRNKVNLEWAYIGQVEVP